jgi:hypothetical protein
MPRCRCPARTASEGLDAVRSRLDFEDDCLSRGTELVIYYQVLCANCNAIKRYEEDEAQGARQHRKKSN